MRCSQREGLGADPQQRQQRKTSKRPTLPQNPECRSCLVERVMSGDELVELKLTWPGTSRSQAIQSGYELSLGLRSGFGLGLPMARSKVWLGKSLPEG